MTSGEAPARSSPPAGIAAPNIFDFLQLAAIPYHAVNRRAVSREYQTLLVDIRSENAWGLAFLYWRDL